MDKNGNMMVDAKAPVAKLPLSMHPHKFALWIFIVTVMMLFAAFTSAYIVRQAEGGTWSDIELPSLFIVNTVILLGSSFTMHWALRSAKRDNLSNIRLALVLTTILGTAFLVGQWYGWEQLVSSNVMFVSDDPSGSFIYVLTGVHALHIVSAVVVLLFTLVSAFRLNIHSKKLHRIEMCATYWHFLDGLWVYLFLFLLLNN